MKTIHLEDYAKLSGVSKPAISYRIINKLVLPGVTKIKFDSTLRRYLLDFNEMPVKELRGYFQKKKRQLSTNVK